MIVSKKILFELFKMSNEKDVQIEERYLQTFNLKKRVKYCRLEEIKNLSLIFYGRKLKAASLAASEFNSQIQSL